MTTEPHRQFADLYAEWADPIFRHCLARTSDRDQAKDLTQETFVRLWDYLRGGEVVRSAKALLYRIANNLIVDYYRKHKAIPLSAFEERNPVDDLGDDPSDHWYARHDSKQLLKVLEQLPSHYRQVITMRYLDELTPPEIAEILRESENAVSVRLHRGLKQLRSLLKHHESQF